MNGKHRSSAPVNLDWSRLLGFDQVRRPEGTVPSRIGAKVGRKPEGSSSVALVRIGAKVGRKTQRA